MSACDDTLRHRRQDQLNKDLFFSISCGSLQAAQGFLDLGANLEATDCNGETPLARACECGHASIFRMLLQRGSRVDGRSRVDGCSHEGSSNATKRRNNTPLMQAVLCGGGFSAKTVPCLVNAGANVNARNSFGLTPLHLACREGNLEIVRYLIEHGAALHARDGAGRCPLYSACSRAPCKKSNSKVDGSSEKVIPVSVVQFRIVQHLLKVHQDRSALCSNRKHLEEFDVVESLVRAACNGHADIVRHLCCWKGPVTMDSAGVNFAGGFSSCLKIDRSRLHRQNDSSGPCRKKQRREVI